MEVASSPDAAVSSGSAPIDPLGPLPGGAPPPIPTNGGASRSAPHARDADDDPAPWEQEPETMPGGRGVQPEEQLDQFVNFIKQFCEPRFISPAWSFLKPDMRLRIDIPPKEFVASMVHELGTQTVLNMGFLEKVGDEIRPISGLGDDPPLYVTINRKNNCLEFQPIGDLFPIARTAIDFALERLSPEASPAAQQLFVVTGEDDSDILRALGLRVVTSTGLESLRHTDVARVFPDDPRTDLDWRYHLVLVDFDVANLDNTPSLMIAEVIQRLADVADAYHLDPGRRFSLCRPTDEEFETLESLVTFEDQLRIRQLFEAWATNAMSKKLANWRVPLRRPALTYSEASQALRRALAQKDLYLRRVEVQAALPAYRAICQRALLAKLDGAVDRAEDVLDQLELIAASDHAQTFFETDPLLRAAEAVLAGKTPPSTRELNEEQFETRQRCLNELRRIHQNRRPKRR